MQSNLFIGCVATNVALFGFRSVGMMYASKTPKSQSLADGRKSASEPETVNGREFVSSCRNLLGNTFSSKYASSSLLR
mgnify:CR=1 FL=1